MATTKLVPPYEKAAAAAAAEDDYIDMDISSATLFCYTTTTAAAAATAKCSPPHHSIEFEFQMSSAPLQRGEETTPSPADELFYKGKLLPLHLPPRVEMVESLAARFQRNNNAAHIGGASVSAPSSCYVSGELIPRQDYFGGRSSAELQKKRRWSEKLKSISQSNLGRKMKASRAYIKSLFTKSDESSTAAAAAASSQPIACSSGHLKPSTLIKSIERERLADEEELLHHRKSFSGAINWHFATTTPKSSSNSMTSSSSSSSSFSSVNSGSSGGGFYGPVVLKRSSSANSEVESPIEGAIAHCKKSQQPARKSVSDVGCYTLTASKIVAAACENKERPGLCRG